MKINPLKILAGIALRLAENGSDDVKYCRVCGEAFEPINAEWNYNVYFSDRGEEYCYGLEFPEMDICDECAIEETEDNYY